LDTSPSLLADAIRPTCTDWRGISLFRQKVLNAAIEWARLSIPVEYDGVTGGFAETCRRADEDYRTRQESGKLGQQVGRPGHSPFGSEHHRSCQLQDDAQRLRDFIAGYPASEARDIIAYAKGRKACQ